MGFSTIPELLYSSAAVRPNSVAYISQAGDELTFARCAHQSSAIARGLAARGVNRGDLVALVFDEAQRFDFVVSWFGAILAGAAPLALSTRTEASSVQALIDQVSPVGVLIADSCPPISVAGWVETSAELLAGRDSAPCPGRFDRLDLAGILFSAGTTGTPKPVAYSHANALAADALPCQIPGILSEPGVLLHSFDCSAGIPLLPFHQPRPTLVMQQFAPALMCEIIAEYGVVSVVLTPAQALSILNSDAAEHHDLSSVVEVWYTGSPMPATAIPLLSNVFPNATLLNGYSSTEASPAGTVMPYDPERLGSLGRPDWGSQMKIVDEEGREVEQGATGEICLRVPGVPLRYYFRDPVRTSLVFRDGWVHMGDLGFVDGEGFLFLTDRRSDFVTRGTRAISTIDVEIVLQTHPAVVEAVVLGVPDAALGEDIVAAVTLKGPTPERELQAFLAERLATYQVPRKIIVLDSMPRGPRGKVIKHLLRDQFRLE